MKKNPADSWMMQALFLFSTLFLIHSPAASNGRVTFPHSVYLIFKQKEVVEKNENFRN